MNIADTNTGDTIGIGICIGIGIGIGSGGQVTFKK
jgi:hypothetical protein